MPDSLIKMFFDLYRERAEHYGYQASPYQMGHLVPVYVGDTDEQAEKEAAGHVLWLYQKGLRHKWEQFFPPGYSTRDAMRSIVESKSKPWNIVEHSGEMDFANFSFKQLNDKGFCIVGSANTVRERLAQYSNDLGHGLILALTHFGDMPNDRCRRNMERFSSEVMPALRKEFSHMA